MRGHRPAHSFYTLRRPQENCAVDYFLILRLHARPVTSFNRLHAGQRGRRLRALGPGDPTLRDRSPGFFLVDGKHHSLDPCSQPLEPVVCCTDSETNSRPQLLDLHRDGVGGTCLARNRSRAARC